MEKYDKFVHIKLRVILKNISKILAIFFSTEWKIVCDKPLQKSFEENQ